MTNSGTDLKRIAEPIFFFFFIAVILVSLFSAVSNDASFEKLTNKSAIINIKRYDEMFETYNTTLYIPFLDVW